MSLESLIEHYGYFALFVGAFLEGETVLVIAGFAAHRGYLSLPWVIVVAFLGTFVSDQMWFAIGRIRGRTFLENRPSWNARAERVRGMLQRHKLAVVLGFRFLYGLRNATPLVLGASGFRTSEFLILNGLGGALWAGVVSLAGYVFGQAMEAFFKDVRRYEALLVGLMVLVGVSIWAAHRLYRRRR